MNWLAIFGGIAVFAIAMTAGLAWWLWRRVRALYAELSTAGVRLGDLARLAGEAGSAPSLTGHRADVGLPRERLEPIVHDRRGPAAPSEAGPPAPGNEE